MKWMSVMEIVYGVCVAIINFGVWQENEEKSYDYGKFNE